MKFSALLAELRENILHDRSDRVEGLSDRLWSDETLLRYITEAQNQFAAKSLILRDDANADVCRVELVEGTSEYALHESVIAVISAKLTGDTFDLRRVGHALLDAYHPVDRIAFDNSQWSTLPPGKPLVFTTDEAISVDDTDALNRVKLRLYPTPGADQDGLILRLRVVRLPLVEANSKTLNIEPEIPRIHQIDMLDWAAYLALRIVDVDAGWKSRALEFKATFEQNVVAARRLAMRRLFTPKGWGFGQGGFTWGS